MTSNEERTLDPRVLGSATAALEAVLRNGVIAQDHVIDALLPAFRRYFAGLSNKRHPIGNYLFLGPTGVGKTLTGEVLAEHFHGNPQAMVRIDCGEFHESHEVAKALGAPPGYASHKETVPRLHKTVVEKYGDPKAKKPSILLFDEVEKAHHTFWDVTLGMTSNAQLTTADGLVTDFSNTIILYTSNLGAREIEGLNKGLGFTGAAVNDSEPGKKNRKRVALAAARKHFTPEFRGRLDGQLVFNSLGPDALRNVLRLELKKLQQRLLSSDMKVILRCDPTCCDWLLENGTDPESGARDMAKTIERSLVTDLAGLTETAQIKSGDMVQASFLHGAMSYRVMAPGEMAESLP